MEVDAVAFGERLHQLETYTASRQVIVGISRVETFWVKNGDSRWENLIGYMMVADNEIYSSLFGVSYLFYRLNATV